MAFFFFTEDNAHLNGQWFYSNWEERHSLGTIPLNIKRQTNTHCNYIKNLQGTEQVLNCLVGCSLAIPRETVLVIVLLLIRQYHLPIMGMYASNAIGMHQTMFLWCSTQFITDHERFKCTSIVDCGWGKCSPVYGSGSREIPARLDGGLQEAKLYNPTLGTLVWRLSRNPAF